MKNENLENNKKSTLKSLGNRKVFDFLRKFSASELSEFQKFINSPYFNSNLHLIKLWDHLARFSPDFSHEKLTTLSAFEAVFPHRPYNDDELRRLLSELLVLIKAFISYQRYSEDEFAQKMHLLKYYDSQEMHSEFGKLLRAMFENESDGKVDSGFFYRNFLLEQEWNRFESSKDLKVLQSFRKLFSEKILDGRKRTVKNFKEINYQYASKALDRFYFFLKTIYLCQRINNMNETGIPDDAQKIAGEVALISAYEVEASDISFIIWKKALLLLNGGLNKLQFLELYELIKANHSTLNILDIRNLCAYLQNSAKKILHDDDQTYYSFLFDVFCFQYDLGVFSGLNFTSSIVRNITTVSLNLGQVEWLESFLKNKEEEIRRFQDGSFKISSMRLWFAQKKYSEIMTIFQDAESEARNIYDKVSLYRLKIKIHFEEKDATLFNSAVNTFRGFLSNNRGIIREIHLEVNRQFISFSLSLFKHLSKAVYMPPSVRHLQLEKIKDEILNFHPSTEKEWLKENVNKMLK